MNPIKKLLSVLLTVCMTLFLLPMAALAVEEPNNYLVTDENNVDRGTYSTLANAVAHANSGWTILVINSSGSSSIDETTPVTIKNGKTLTLNLCEQTLSLSSDSGTPLTVSSGGRLTVTNNGTFNVTTTDSEPALVVNGGTLTLDTSFAANPEIHVTGTKIGLSVTDGGSATVTSATATGASCTGVAADMATVVIMGDVTVSGADSTGVDLREGALTVNGNVTATGTSSVGAVLPAGGANNTITIKGSLTASTYIMANGSPMTISDGINGIGVDIGYRIYSGSGGTQIVKVKMPVQNTDTAEYYPFLSNALEEAANGNTITLLANITESVNYTVSTGKTITIDGGGFKLTGQDSATESVALTLTGTGTVILKGLTLQGGTSTGANGVSIGLRTGGILDIRSYGIVSVKGGTADNSYGLDNSSSGTLDVTNASASGNFMGVGAANNGPGTVNVGDAQGNALQGIGAANSGAGTINVTKAEGSLCGVNNQSTGTVNVTTATGVFFGVYNVSTGIVNVVTIISSDVAVKNDSNGKVNVKTITSGTFTTTTNMDVAAVTLNKGTGASCVLDSITVAKTGNTTIGTLPSVYKDGAYNNTWYTDSAKTTAFSGTTVTGATTLYSSYYIADVKVSTAAIFGVTAPVRGAAPVTSLAETPEYTSAIAWSPAVSGTFTASTVYTATITLTPKTGYTTTGVAANFFTVAGATATNSAGSGIITAIFPTTAAADSGNPSTGGGFYGGSTTTPKTSVSGSTATTTVTPTVSGGVASGSVTADQMNDALAKAKTAAGTSGTPDVKIQIDGASGASRVGTTIPHASMQALVSGNAAALTISGPTGSVSFGAAALKTISGAAGGDVTVTTSKVDTSTLPDAAKQAVGSHPVYEFSVTSSGKTISQFGGDVTVSVPYTPASGEDTNAIVIYYITADGTPTLVPDARYDAATGTVIFTTTHFSTYAVGYHKVAFSDVAEDAWCYDAVTFLAARGITGGTTETAFNPNATLTRGQFITLVMRAYGIEPDESAADNFSDAGDTYYTGYLAAAKQMGISNGVGGNKFAPKQAVSRQQMFTLLYNALKAIDQLPEGDSGKTLSDFTDSANISSYAQEAMEGLVKSGAVSGSNGNLRPTATTTRAQMAQVLYNLLGK